MLGCVAIYIRVLSKRNAKAIFGLGAAEFNSLPLCGYREYWIRYNEGICYDRSIRDCAAAALKRLGSFKKLAEEAPLLKQNKPLQRLRGVIAELQKLHPTLQESPHFKAIQNSAKRLTLRKSFRITLDYRRSTDSAYMHTFNSTAMTWIRAPECEALRAAVVQSLEDLTLYIGSSCWSQYLMFV